MPLDGFALGLLFCFAVATVLYGSTTDYAPLPVNSTVVPVQNQFEVFSNIHVMAFFGFGILMTFSVNIGLTAAARSLVLGSVAALWYMLIFGLLNQAIAGVRHPLNTVTLDRNSLVRADFAVSSVLIAYGALIGRVTAVQSLVMVVIHVMFYTVNDRLGDVSLQINDPGGSMTIHLFGALFGVTSSWVLERQAGRKDIEGAIVTTTTSNVRALLGTLFLFCYFPSFNCYLMPDTTPFFPICTVNTHLALLASAFAAIVFSHALSGKHTRVVDVQKAVLAGGVVIGATSNTLVNPFGAVAIGIFSGGVTSLSLNVLSPALERNGFRDTCGVASLHGVAGFCGGIIAIVHAATAILFRYNRLTFTLVWSAYLDGFSQSRVTAFHLAYLLLTIGLSIAGGIVAGFLMRLAPSLKRFYTDSEEWVL